MNTHTSYRSSNSVCRIVEEMSPHEFVTCLTGECADCFVMRNITLWHFSQEKQNLIKRGKPVPVWTPTTTGNIQRIPEMVRTEIDGKSYVLRLCSEGALPSCEYYWRTVK
jgi:hypothetical protein